MTVRDIVMNVPPMNAMGSRLMTWLREQIRDAAGDPIFLTGAGKAFSAGLDIAEVAALDVDGLRAFLTLLDELVYDLYTYPGPVVALVNGHAIAGGCVLALCCDFRVADARSEARIGLNEVALGLSFPPGVMALARDRIPRRHRERALLGAELHDVETAVELNYLDAVADDAEAVARARLEFLASHPRGAYRAAKLAWRAEAMRITPGERARWFDDALPMWTSDDVRGRLLARLKR